MIDDLNLYGLELIFFAFLVKSTKKNGTFEISLKETASFLKCAKLTAIKTIKSLEEKGLIIVNRVKNKKTKVNFVNSYKVV